MLKLGLNVIANAMDELNLEYAFGQMQFDHAPIYPYFTGEYQEGQAESEDHRQENTFIINGFTRGTLEELENVKEKIKSYFIDSITAADQSGAVAITYENSLMIPVEDAELKRLQINLSVVDWKVN